MSFQKKHAIRDLESKDTAQDIDDNFDAIWAALRLLKSRLTDDEEVTPSVVGRDGAIGQPGEDGAPGGHGGSRPATVKMLSIPPPSLPPRARARLVES